MGVLSRCAQFPDFLMFLVCRFYDVSRKNQRGRETFGTPCICYTFVQEFVQKKSRVALHKTCQNKPHTHCCVCPIVLHFCNLHLPPFFLFFCNNYTVSVVCVLQLHAGPSSSSGPRISNYEGWGFGRGGLSGHVVHSIQQQEPRGNLSGVRIYVFGTTTTA